MAVSENVQIVLNWHQALNSRNNEELTALVKENLKIGGPRGETEGVQEMLDWVGRAQITLVPLQYFAAANTVVVEEQGKWHSPETGQVIGAQTLASAFVIEENRITGIYRYENLLAALSATGLQEQDKINVNQAH